MALHGHTKIELTNVKTGEVEVVEKDNLVTNALQELFDGMMQTSIYGVNTSSAYQRPFAYVDGTNVYVPQLVSELYQNDDSTCFQVLGGIKLFEEQLDENVDNIIQPPTVNVTGYASNTVCVPTDLRRGNYKADESGPVDGGYKFVWEWDTTKANGTIASICLTDALGGREPYPFPATVQNYSHNTDYIPGKSYGSTRSTYAYDNTNKSLYIIKINSGTTSSSSITVCEYDYDLWKRDAKLLFRNYYDKLDNKRKIKNNITFSTDIPLDNNSQLYAATVSDNYIWVLYHNNYLSSEIYSYKTVLIRITKSDFSVTTRVLPETGSNFEFKDLSTYPGRGDSQLILSCAYSGTNYPYIYDYTNNVLTKLNLQTWNMDDFYVSPITIGDYAWIGDKTFASPNRVPCLTRLSCYNTNISGTTNRTGEFAGLFYTYHYDNAVEIITANRLTGGVLKRQFYYAADPLKFGIDSYIISGYLATINNISPVTKTSDKTMKITYTLYESTEEE